MIIKQEPVEGQKLNEKSASPITEKQPAIAPKYNLSEEEAWKA